MKMSDLYSSVSTASYNPSTLYSATRTREDLGRITQSL